MLLEEMQALTFEVRRLCDAMIQNFSELGERVAALEALSHEHAPSPSGPPDPAQAGPR